jgi:hypothetical protein
MMHIFSYRSGISKRLDPAIDTEPCLPALLYELLGENDQSVLNHANEQTMAGSPVCKGINVLMQILQPFVTLF